MVIAVQLGEERECREVHCHGGCKMCRGVVVADEDGGSPWREVREWCSCGVVQWWPARFRCGGGVGSEKMEIENGQKRRRLPWRVMVAARV